MPRKIQKEIKFYKDRLEEAQKAGGIGIFDWNIKTGTIWRTKKEFEILGLTSRPTQEGPMEQINVFPEDAAEIKRKMDQVPKGVRKSRIESDFRVIHKDGSVHWIRNKAHLYYTKEGVLERMTGINYDVTEIIQHESALAFKAEAVRILSSRLSYKKNLSLICKLATTLSFCDWSCVELVQDTKELVPVSVSQKTDLKINFAAELFSLQKTQGLHRAIILSGKTFTSVLILPIKASGKVIGRMTFLCLTQKKFNKSDLTATEQIASRIGLTIENRQLYSAIETERLHLRKLLKNVPAIVWEASISIPKETITLEFISEHAKRLLDYPLTSWTKPNFIFSIIAKEDTSRVKKDIFSFFQKDQPGVTRFRFLDTKGEEKWVELQFNSVRENANSSINARGVILDISEGIKELKKKDEFISIASHEFKTPITSLKAFVQILERTLSKKKDTQITQYVGRMNEQIDKLTKLVSDFLDITKIQNGKLQYNLQDFSLNTLITDTLESLRPTTPRKIILRLPDENIEVKADPDRISQVIFNLLANANKYSPPNKKIIISLSIRKNKALIGVKDFGLGIPDEEKTKIFDRFYRVSNRTTSGLGIGLYISQEIITYHGGKLGVKSKLGQGSLFYFTLPMNRALSTAHHS